MSEYDAVLFDNDGVLVEPVDLDVLRRAARDAFAALDVHDPAEDHLEDVMIRVDPPTLRRVCDRYGVDPDEFWVARDRIAHRAQRAEVESGRAALYGDFDAVRSLDLPTGIVSSNQQETVDFMHDHFGTRDLFGPVYGREPTVESLRRKKPSTHYLDRALADLGMDGDADVLFVGDSESDVAAAANAGMDSAFVRRPHRRGYALETTPTYELDSLRDLRNVTGVPTP